MEATPTREQIRKGARVSVETKRNQGTGRLTEGTVEEILTPGRYHPHGIKVRLDDGQVGRVKKMLPGAGEGSGGPPAGFADLARMGVPKVEDEHNEFKEFYQYDDAIGLLRKLPDGKREIAIKSKKIEAQRRFATAVCSLGNKDGGFVYLGVRSDGSVAGLERDRRLEGFEDYSDAFARHIESRLRELIRDDAFVLSKLRMRFREIGGRTVCIIQVLPSPRPLFLHGAGGEEFYVRGMSPQAKRLDGLARAEYIHERFYRNR